MSVENLPSDAHVRPSSGNEVPDSSEPTSLVDRLRLMVGDLLHIAPPDPAVELLDLGANSLDFIRLANRLDEELGFRPAVDELFELPTIAAIAAYYDARAEAGAVIGRLPHTSDGGGRQVATNVLLDFLEREQFKRQQPGRRGDLEDCREIPLEMSGERAAALEERARERRTHRHFQTVPVSPDAFGALFACFREWPGTDVAKRWYPSAGGLYPVQVYAHVKPGRVTAVDAGTYYYDPARHALRQLVPEAVLDRSVHALVNRRTFDAAAFSVFLVGQLNAIQPMYGDLARDFCFVEAGCMAQLMMMHAPSAGLALCGVGSLQADELRALLLLEDSHVMLHSFLGGIPSDAGAGAKGTGPASDLDRMADVLKQLEQTSIDQMRSMLAARRRTPAE